MNETSGIIIVSIPVASLWEVKRCNLSWGPTAVVLDPDELRDEISVACQRLLIENAKA
jgi:hypothetical protein